MLSTINKCLTYFSFYFKYVNDILFATSANEIIDLFNSIHIRLQFTIKTEKDDEISFLNVKLIVEEERIIYSLVCIENQRILGDIYHFDHSIEYKRDYHEFA